MRNRIIILTVCVLGFLSVGNLAAKACINDDDHSSHYVPTTNDRGIPFPSIAIQDFNISFNKTPEQLYKERYWSPSSNIKSGFKKDQNNALKELLTGEASKAVEMFLEIEQKYPGQYSTASNLGTAYELSGNNPKALEWINEGIKRNKRSHYGTEWLHSKILEAKINLEKDPEYFKREWSILPSTRTMIGAWDNGSQGKNLDAIEIALIYQLKERLVFVKPKDPVVADLLFTYSWLVAERSEDIKTALELLKWSNEYGFSDQKLLDKTVTRYKNKVLFKNLSAIFYAAFFLIMLYLVTLFFKLDRKRKKSDA